MNNMHSFTTPIIVDKQRRRDFYKYINLYYPFLQANTNFNSTITLEKKV